MNGALTSEILFRCEKFLVGAVHVGALPGTPAASSSAAARTVAEIVAQAAREAVAYRDGGADGVIVENMHDVPYLRGDAVGPEIVAAMALVARAVKDVCRSMPVGVQILAGANRAAMAVAHAAGLDFVRVEGFAFAHVADEGFIDSSAAELLRYRRMIGAERVRVWADVKKKHAAHSITADTSLGETARAAEFMRADAVIVSGTATGAPPTASDVREAKTHTNLPVVLGSGIDPDNLAEFFDDADGFIVGTYCKRGGVWTNPVDARRVRKLAQKLKELRARA